MEGLDIREDMAAVYALMGVCPQVHTLVTPLPWSTPAEADLAAGCTPPHLWRPTASAACLPWTSALPCHARNIEMCRRLLLQHGLLWDEIFPQPILPTKACLRSSGSPLNIINILINICNL